MTYIALGLHWPGAFFAFGITFGIILFKVDMTLPMLKFGMDFIIRFVSGS